MDSNIVETKSFLQQAILEMAEKTEAAVQNAWGEYDDYSDYSDSYSDYYDAN
jgi:hypothetical protein